MRRRERELEAVLDDDEEIEPVKAEALRELEAIADFMRKHPWRSRDCVERCARAVSRAIRCLHARLAVAVDSEGKPDPVLQAFARHLDEHLLIALGRGRHPGQVQAGRRTSRLVHLPAADREWCGSAECGVRKSGVRGARGEVRGARDKVEG